MVMVADCEDSGSNGTAAHFATSHTVDAAAAAAAACRCRQLALDVSHCNCQAASLCVRHAAQSAVRRSSSPVTQQQKAVSKTITLTARHFDHGVSSSM